MTSVPPLPTLDFRAALNDEQYAAVTSPPGPALVLAGAGSGKTRTLTFRVAWLLHQGIPPAAILLLTFTNKAAREMLGRVEDLTGIPASYFLGGTFHGVAQRILRRHAEHTGLKPNFTILDEGDAEALLTDTIRDTHPAFLKDKENPRPKVIADILSYHRNTFEPLPALAESRFPWREDMPQTLATILSAYQERKLSQNVTDYDDLLTHWLHVLQNRPDVLQLYQQRFQYILVDEYQDTNALQSRIIDLLADRTHNLMAVGDEAQCIYTWRGAKFENIMDFAQRHPGTTIHKIETNYRSSPEILDFANHSLLQQPTFASYGKILRPIRPSRQKPWFVPVMDTPTQARFIVQRLQGLMDEGYRPGDIAILYRAHYHSMDIQMELSRVGMPFIITSGIRFFEQAHIRDLIAQLRFVANPTDDAAFLRFTTLLPKVGPKTAARLLELARKNAQKKQHSLFETLSDEALLAKVPEEARESWRDMAYTLENTATAMHGTPPPPPTDNDLFAAPPEPHQEPQPPDLVIRTAIDGWYGDYLRLLYPNWQSRRDDLDSLIGFAQRYDDMQQLLAELVLLNNETHERSHADPPSDCLRLSTIHQAKGLEFPVVFLIGLAQGLFPLKRAIEQGDIEEERRLFYVGITRAQDDLYLLFPRIATQNGAPQMLEASTFIQEIPTDRFEVLRHAPPHPYR